MKDKESSLVLLRLLFVFLFELFQDIRLARSQLEDEKRQSTLWLPFEVVFRFTIRLTWKFSLFSRIGWDLIKFLKRNFDKSARRVLLVKNLCSLIFRWIRFFINLFVSIFLFLCGYKTKMIINPNHLAKNILGQKLSYFQIEELRPKSHCLSEASLRF